MEVVNDDYMVCAECMMAIANDDFSGLDYYYSPDDAAERMAEIKQGMAEAGGYIVVGNSGQDEEFSRRTCDCCGDYLAGTRHHCTVLSNEEG